MLKASAAHTLGADTLTAAVQETYAVGRRPIVLFDTVDLLLHDAARRDRSVELLTVVDELACTFVMACRPGEVQSHPQKSTRDTEGAARTLRRRLTAVRVRLSHCLLPRPNGHS